MMTHYSDIIVFLVLIDFNITKYRILHQQLARVLNDSQSKLLIHHFIHACL